MALPTVLLHDHLDGGLRPNTVLELAEESGYSRLPTQDPDALAEWFDQSQSGSLEAYLAAFQHTIGVMQTGSALERVAYEAVVDNAADGVTYLESRFSPPLHTTSGLEPDEVIEAVAAGFERGAGETGLRWGLIIDCLRHIHDSEEIADLALRNRAKGVVGFDLAGPEAGYPPTLHLAGIRRARESGLRVTLHAGEAAGKDGVAHIASSMDSCGAERIGHGIELVHDCMVEDGDIVAVGPVAARVRNRRIPLEMCPASNLATSGMAPEDHPIGMFFRAGFNVTVSTDNRLMSSTSMAAEFSFLRKHHGFTIDDLALTTRRSLDAAFCDWETKRELWETIIAPAYAAEAADLDSTWR